MRRVCCRAAARTAGVFVWLAAVALAGGQERTQAQLLQDAIQLIETTGDLRGAIAVLLKASEGPDRASSARAWLFIGDAYERLGAAEAREAYERAESFKDQPEVVAEAGTRIQRLTAAATAGREGLALSRLWTWQHGLLGPPSPDGRWLPVIDWSAGELCLRSPATDETQPITRTGRFESAGEFPYSAALSPDGARMAYGYEAHPAPGTTRAELRVTTLAGGETRTIFVRDDGDVFVGGWMPNGREVLVRAGSDLVLVGADSGSSRTLSRSLGELRSVRLSPDGRYVAYDLPQAGGPERDILVREVKSGAVRRLVGHRANDASPIWTRDGRGVVFVSDRTGAMGIWRVAVDAGRATGEPRLIYGNIGRVELEGLSPSGSLYLRQWAPRAGLTLPRGPARETADARPDVSARTRHGLRVLAGRADWETWVLEHAVAPAGRARRP